MFDVRRSNRSGFTLLEVLLAITITGFVLASASAMLVSVSNIWSNRQESNFFENHVDGVAEFVQSCFTRAGTEIALSAPDTPSESGENREGEPDRAGEAPEVSVSIDSENEKRTNPSSGEKSGSSLLRQSENPIDWAKPPGFASYRDPLINFRLRDNPPLFVNTDNAPVMGIDAFLYFDRDEGLSLLWYSVLQEEVEDENDLRRTAVSPYVTSIRYVYWDERFERWEEEDEPQEGEEDEFLLPRFIKLIFEHEGVTKERTVSVPVPSRTALIF
ncbi:PulJ/GspJ family protein [Coraliomargarita sinensis]|nr:prepilin-type N-terminal cleavage/methylation domain-containing protein [Coraliomargarita sinensis]